MIYVNILLLTFLICLERAFILAQSFQVGKVN